MIRSQPHSGDALTRPATCDDTISFRLGSPTFSDLLPGFGILFGCDAADGGRVGDLNEHAASQVVARIHDKPLGAVDAVEHHDAVAEIATEADRANFNLVAAVDHGDV